MSYGRRFSGPGLVRRGRRTYNRTSRMGYTTRKALRRGLPVRKRLLRQKVARPLKKRRVMTRSLAYQRQRSPFKTQREIIATSFMGNSDNSNYRATQAPEEAGQLYSLFLSPKVEVTTNSYRKVAGSKCRYIGCNIKGTLNVLGDYIIRVVQLLDPDIIGGTALNVASSSWTEDFFKKQAHNDGEFSYADLDVLTNQERMYAAINEARFKVLKTKYITLPPSASSGVKKKGFHMFIPMNTMLENSRTMTTLEFANNRTDHTLSTVTRNSYFKPVFLLIEPIMRTGDEYIANNNQAIGNVDLSIKHSFKDTI